MNASPSRVIRAPGRLVVDPIDAFAEGSPLGQRPYGGTPIGRVMACVLRNTESPYEVETEALGEVTEVLQSGSRWWFFGFLRGWDRDSLQQLFPDNYEEGAISQHATFLSPGQQQAGAPSTHRCKKIVFVPDDPVLTPGVVLYSALPAFAPNAEIAMQRQTEFGIPLSLRCMRDAQGRHLAIGRLVDLPL